MSEEFEKLRDFLFNNLYHNPIAKSEEGKAEALVESLYNYYLAHIDLLPDDFKKHIDEDGEARATADYIACMTDRYAVREYERIFVPKDWN